ncbi:lycopene cyclase domain-containing protein [Saccharicrinis sp. 156]|uniref:lycopene cyclase domain-containing protein n=1 Tax=Saccharicrinis sp. 156 TaxID=3417574 RepID=UPI003D32F3FE
MSLYFWILICSGSIPFLYSFHPKLKFYKYWPSLFTSILLVAIPYLIWDYFFTENRYWGFNESYLSGYYIFNLPVEEVLFFVVIPYCCVFTFHSLKHYFPFLSFSKKITATLATLLLIASFLIVMRFSHLPYTIINFSSLVFVLILAFIYDWKLLSVYFWVFPVILIPFFIVNGILTGFGIENEIVWYSPHVFMGIRILTIPLEDIFYAFSLVLSNLFLMEVLQRKVKMLRCQ